MKGSLDFRPCTTLEQQRGSAEWCLCVLQAGHWAFSCGFLFWRYLLICLFFFGLPDSIFFVFS